MKTITAIKAKQGGRKQVAIFLDGDLAFSLEKKVAREQALTKGQVLSGAESLEAIELVTAGGELIKASETENADYFWAARGAGPGFFGIVTKYYLKLYALPRAIHGSVYHYTLDDAPAIYHQDQVRSQDRAQAVSDDDAGPPGHDFTQRILYQCL